MTGALRNRDDVTSAVDGGAGGPNPADILHRLLKLNVRLLAPFSMHLEKRHRISVNEFRLLMLIGRLGVSASHELAEMTGVNTMGVSRSVAALQRHGRIEVAEDPNNRRRKTLRLTEEGQRLYDQMLPTTDKVAGYLFGSLRLDEIMAFDRHLTSLIDSLEARDAEGRSVFLESTRPEDDLTQG
ncbi:MAG: MarR family transcriptional regulator [Sphingomonas bacterium]|jgi:DNA-binding MarR family transcriptional regulator|nr:MarR family transcriptional regulator [Sphingomonas bacterium]MDB5717615.1 MarR family transcriptional regulator [Sphingomonas bacterium]